MSSKLLSTVLTEGLFYVKNAPNPMSAGALPQSGELTALFLQHSPGLLARFKGPYF